MKRVSVIATLMLFTAFLAGCPPVPGSRLYKPISEWEQRAFERANRNIFPNDVRKGSLQFDTARVAWPGIVTSREWKKTDSTIEVHFVFEHHYYDWIEDFSIQQERIFLSPRGEGVFETTWPLKPTADTTEVLQSLGKLAIVYGVPTSVNDSIISIRCYYIRLIDKHWFATDIFDYGRPGEPVKVMRIP